jgi:uncharacterized cofD-like protein
VSVADELRSPGGRLLDPSVVALGGGHGLHATLSALRRVVTDLTAIVTVADNGGSSGRLRGEFGVLPPGDLRMALAALCGDDEWGRTWAEVVQHRFAGEGDMRGHVTGNLLIVSLWELLGDHVQALDWMARLLGAQGRVLPMATSPIDIMATVRGVDPSRPDELTVVRGQVEVATTAGRIEEVALDPADPTPCPEALAAVREADLVVLGPGSWYTSVIPHLMVPQLRQALEETSARVALVINLEPQEGETPGYSVKDHLRVFHHHAPGVRIDLVVADPTSILDRPALTSYVAELGGRLVVADVAADGGGARHDPVKLAAVFDEVLASEPAVGRGRAREVSREGD